jgi:uncharacterized protein YpmS
MRRIVMLLLVLGVATMLVAAVQDTSSQSQSGQSQAQQPSNSQATQQSQTDSNKQMTGKVSSDGKTFTNDKDSKSYTVDNPDALKGHEGEPVALVVQMDPTTNTVHILTVTAPEQK